MSNNLIQQYLADNAATTTILKKALDAQATRQRAHVQNIANAETPNYKRVVVDFEGMLKEATDLTELGPIKQTDPGHLPNATPDIEQLSPRIRQEMPDPNGTGVNGVDIDKEMAEMAETQIRYLTSLELLKRRYNNLKSVIRGQP
jgi:flagellar basal-body rod protein FlgB